MKTSISILIMLFSFLSLQAQTGKVYDELSLKSDILGMERKYAIYLPPDYETSQRRYPVLYLLHGRTDDQTGWVQFGEVLRIADNAINEGSATSLIIVMPDADTERTGYYNQVKGDWNYEDFFFEEFMPYIERTYRIKGEKQYRAVAGLSMGGGGSFIYALHRPDLFSSSCPLSASVRMIHIDSTRAYMEDYHIAYTTQEEVNMFYNKYSALNLINTMPTSELKSIKWYIDCGDDDSLYEGNSLIHIAMRKRGIPHEFRIRDGGHTWTYWRESLPKVLSFISDAFHRH